MRGADEAKRIEAALLLAMRKATRKRNRGACRVMLSKIEVDGEPKPYEVRLTLVTSSRLFDRWEVRTITPRDVTIALVWQHDGRERAARELAFRLFELGCGASVAP